jgi:CMP-N-acetylneuraminic acid synthetase
MKIVALVPVKKNSVRVPNKNFNEFHDGKSLLRLTLEKLSRIDLIHSIIVFSSEDIDGKHLYGTRAEYLNRSSSLDSDLTSMNLIIEEFISKVSADIYILIHVTSPFLSEKSINEGLNSIIHGKHDSSFSVQKKQIFYWNDKSQSNYNLSSIPRTQDLPPIYIETSGFYAFKKEVFMKYYRRIGEIPHMVLVNNIESMDIDDKDDYMLAQSIYGLAFK